MYICMHEHKFWIEIQALECRRLSWIDLWQLHVISSQLYLIFHSIFLGLKDKRNINRKGVDTHKQMYIERCNFNLLDLNGEILAFYSWEMSQRSWRGVESERVSIKDYGCLEWFGKQRNFGTGAEETWYHTFACG